MKKLIFLSILITRIVFGKTMQVVEIGTNVKMNIATKIEATKTALENIQQTKNQIEQLKNDALNLQNWANSALLETVGLTTKDIHNIMEIKRLSGQLYEDATSFEVEWNKDFDINIGNLSLEQLSRVQGSLTEKLNKAQNSAMNFKKNEKKMYDNLKTKMAEFNSLNRKTQGNLDSQQLANEINANVYQSLENLQILLQEQKAEDELKQRQEAQLKLVQLTQERIEAEKEYKKVSEKNKKFRDEVSKYKNNLSATLYPDLNN